jgi:hypothetical protein
MVIFIPIGSTSKYRRLQCQWQKMLICTLTSATVPSAGRWCSEFFPTTNRFWLRLGMDEDRIRWKKIIIYKSAIIKTAWLRSIDDASTTTTSALHTHCCYNYNHLDGMRVNVPCNKAFQLVLQTRALFMRTIIRAVLELPKNGTA